MLPSRRELNFCIIAFFKLYPETLEKSSKKALDFEVKIEKNREKSVSKKYVFSDCVFLSIFGGLGQIWGGVWEGFGASWRLLGHFLASFLEACIQNALRRVLGGLFEGFGKALGGFWEGFWARIWATVLFNVFGCSRMLLGAHFQTFSDLTSSLQSASAGFAKRKQFLNFERLKNRKDSSDFDDFWTKSIASTQIFLQKNSRVEIEA